MKLALPYFLAIAVILTTRQATTIDKPLSAVAWHALGIEAVTGLWSSENGRGYQDALQALGYGRYYPSEHFCG
jgi:hypothetical protein